MWDIEFEESNPGVRPDMSIRWSLSFKQIVAPQEPITYHVRQPTVCSSLWPVSICGSSIPVYTYLREFLDPYEMKLQGNTVNQQAHQHLRYFFRWKHEMIETAPVESAVEAKYLHGLINNMVNMEDPIKLIKNSYLKSFKKDTVNGN